MDRCTEENQRYESITLHPGQGRRNHRMREQMKENPPHFLQMVVLAIAAMRVSRMEQTLVRSIFCVVGQKPAVTRLWGDQHKSASRNARAPLEPLGILVVSLEVQSARETAPPLKRTLGAISI